MIVRPAAVYGPRDRDFLALFRLARFGVALHAANRDHWLSIIHVADLADAIVRSASAPEARGRIYCLGNDEPVAVGRAVLSRCGVCEPGVERRHRDSVVLDRRRRRGRRRRRENDGTCRFGHHAEGDAGKGAVLDVFEQARRARARLRGEHAAQRGLCDTYEWYREHGWL